jgi:hypothetical protein
MTGYMSSTTGNEKETKYHVIEITPTSIKAVSGDTDGKASLACSECGLAYTSGKFCGECGAPRTAVTTSSDGGQTYTADGFRGQVHTFLAAAGSDGKTTTEHLVSNDKKNVIIWATTPSFLGDLRSRPTSTVEPLSPTTTVKITTASSSICLKSIEIVKAGPLSERVAKANKDLTGQVKSQFSNFASHMSSAKKPGDDDDDDWSDSD